MSNPAYVKGRKWEYEVKNRLEAIGYFVMRLGGSKPVDLIAFKLHQQPVVVECKVRLRDPPEFIEFQIAAWEALNAEFVIADKWTGKFSGSQVLAGVPI